MSFADAFTECMQNAGVQVDSGCVTDEGYFTESVNYMKSWFDDLDQITKEAMDAATETSEPVSSLLAEANVAPGVPELLKHYDEAVGWPLSTLLDWTLHCISEASQAGDSSSQSSSQAG